MKKNGVAPNRLQESQRKQKVARRMLKAGKSNAEIQIAVRAEFSAGIGPDTLASIREDLGISGSNRGTPRGQKVNKKKTKAKKPKPSNSLLVLQDNGTSACFRSSLQSLLDQMPKEGVQAFAMRADGTVRVQQVNEFMLTPPAEADKLLGGGL